MFISLGACLISEKPKLTFDNKFQDLVTLRAGNTLKIPVKFSGIPKPAIIWSKDDKPVQAHGRLTLDISDKSTTLILKKVTRDDDGLYTVLAENEAGEDLAKFDIEIIGMLITPFLSFL